MDFQENWFDDMDIPELRHYVRRPSLLAANGFFWAVAALFALLQAGIPVLYWLLSAVWDISYDGYITSMQMLMYLGAMLLPMAVYILSHPDERAAFRLRGTSPGRALGAILAAGAGFFAANFVTILWMVLLEQIGLDNVSTPDVFTGSLPLDILMVSILPAVCEEIVFRGMMLGAYERWGTWKAIWISAMMFAGMHGVVSGLPVHLLLGVALGYVAASTGSLLPGMALHAVYNAIAVVIAYNAPADTADIAVPMIEQIGGAMGVAVSAVMAMIFAALFIGALALIDRVRVRADEPFGSDAVIERKKLGRAEIVLLLSGAVTVLWFYVQDLLTMI